MIKENNLAVTVLGIDPGSVKTGWGVVRELSGVLHLVDCGTILAKGGEFSERLAYIYHHLRSVLGQHIPDEAAVEQVFTAKNAVSALKLGQARGIAVAACAASFIPVFDYEPTMVKKSLVNNGRAEKEQVAFMVNRILGCRLDSLDTTDALAVAVCHLNQRRFHKLTASPDIS